MNFARRQLLQNEVPKPDIIVLSHRHMDHCDYPTLEALATRYPCEIDVVCAYNT